MSKIGKPNIGTNLKGKDSEFPFKHVTFEAVMEHHLAIDLFI